MNDGRRAPPRRRVGAANWALAGVVALCTLLSIGHLEDWAASPAAATTKVGFDRVPGTEVPSKAVPSKAVPTAARDGEKAHLDTKRQVRLGCQLPVMYRLASHRRY